MSGKIVLIDGHSILNRAFFGIPDLTNSEGLHTNAVYGFLNILFRILDEEEPEYLAVAFDVHAPTFRHEMYADYKGTRKPMAPELREQVPVLKEVLHAMNIVTVEKAGYEADDILGTISLRCEEDGLDPVIVSGDRDLLQLASEKTKIRIPKTKKTGTEIEDYYAADVKEKYRVTPTEFIEVKALMGDSSDNIPGVPGIGEKTATSLIAQYHSVENACAHVDEIRPARAQKALRENYDSAVLSRKLSEIDRHARIDFRLEDARKGDLFTQEAYLWMKRLEFKNILARFEVEAPEGGEDTDFRMITERAEAERFFEEAEKELSGMEDPGKIAAAVIADGGKLAGLSFCIRPDAAVFVRAECLPEAELMEQTEHLFSLAGEIISPDLKALARRMPGIEKQKKNHEHAAGSSSRPGAGGVTSHTDGGAGQTGMPAGLDRSPEDGAGGEAGNTREVSGDELQFFDTAVAMYLLNPLKNSYPYEDLAKDYLNRMDIPSRADLIGKLSYAQAAQEKPEELCRTACYEAHVSYLAEPVLEEELRKKEMWDLFAKIEMPLVFTLADMENEGIRADAGMLKEYSAELSGKIGELQQRIYDQAGEEFNINSPKQLGHILFEKLHLPYGKKTKTGYSTAAGVLEKLAPEYPIVSDILDYRQLAKLKSTYADGLADYIADDGRIHGTFNQTITATGRISSTEPNLQNIPIRMESGKLIRKVFLPKEGYVFLDADYSQIELRVLAHMSGDQNLIEAYRNAEDIHRITASKVFHVPLDEVTDQQRRNAKAVNFGIVYGISSFGLSQGLSITRKEAQEYIEKYFETYPDVKKFLDRLVADAKEKGYSVTMFGRRRPVPELSSSNFAQRNFGERIAMNSPIQGTAADIIKIAMNRVRARLEREGMKSKLILQVHDELLVETAEDEVEPVKRILEEEMQGAAQMDVKLETDTKMGRDWYEAH